MYCVQFVHISILTHAGLSGIAVSLTYRCPGHADSYQNGTHGCSGQCLPWFRIVLVLKITSKSLIPYSFTNSLRNSQILVSLNLNPHIFFNYWPSWVVGPWILLEEQMLWRSAVPDNVQIDSALSAQCSAWFSAVSNSYQLWQSTILDRTALSWIQLCPEQWSACLSAVPDSAQLESVLSQTAIISDKALSRSVLNITKSFKFDLKQILAL